MSPGPANPPDVARLLEDGEVLVAQDRALTEDWLRQSAVLAADSIARGDGPACAALASGLQMLADRIRQPEASRLLGVAEVLSAAPERNEIGEFEPGELAMRMLRELVADPALTNRSIALRLGTSETQVSRAGRQLVDGDLALKVKRGRTNRWVVTPRGRAAVASSTPRIRLARTSLDIEAAIGELIAAKADDGIVEAARRVHEAGVLDRQSALPRGSIVRTAERRLDSAHELQLVALTEGVAGEGLRAILSAIGEWGSRASVEVLRDLAEGPTQDADDLYAVIGALGKIGGLAATDILTALVRRASSWPDAADRVAGHAISALATLADGGRGDATDEMPKPRRTDRWWPENPEAAVVTLATSVQALHEASRSAGHSTLTRRRAESAAQLIVDWADANSIRVDRSRTDGGPVAIDFSFTDEELAAFIDSGQRLELVESATRSGEAAEYAMRFDRQEFDRLAALGFAYSDISVTVGGDHIEVRCEFPTSGSGPDHPPLLTIQSDGRSLPTDHRRSKLSDIWSANVIRFPQRVMLRFG